MYSVYMYVYLFVNMGNALGQNGFLATHYFKLVGELRKEDIHILICIILTGTDCIFRTRT